MFIQGFSNCGVTLHFLDRPEDALRMYAHILEAFKDNEKEIKNARHMYASLLKRLGARAFNANQLVRFMFVLFHLIFILI
jgi:hypothetical protein